MFFNNVNKDQMIHVSEIDKLIGKIELIDIREPYEYASGRIPTAKNIPMSVLLRNPKEHLETDELYYLICQSGSRSSMATSYLKSNGFKVIDVVGGTGSYRGRLER